MLDVATPTHPVWKEIAPEITQSEFKNPFSMSPDALRKLYAIRRHSGVPFRIVSDYRGDDSRVGAAQSSHKEIPCTALDLRMLNNHERFKLVRSALELRCERIGIYVPTDYQEKTFGASSGSVHLDFSPTNPPEVMWMKWPEPLLL